jgi:hypothetical protein
MTGLLEAIFAGKPADQMILVWELPSKISRWYKDVSEIDTSKFKNDTYFGVGTRAPGLTAGQRGGSNQVTGIGALWLDIDVKGPAHQKGNIPETGEKALELLGNAFGSGEEKLTPSIIINSGHGFQVYYLLREWAIVTDDNRDLITSICLGLSEKWRAHCKAHGYDADSVHDLSRVMRLPGTMNRKEKDKPVHVEIIESSDKRYTIQSLAAMFCANVEPPKAKAEVCTVPREASKGFPAEKFEALLLTDKNIELSWNREREDFTDKSQSTYDMSLAQYCLRADFTPRETYEVLVEARRRGGGTEKARSYYERTINTVIEEIKKSRGLYDSAEEAFAAASEDLGFEIKNLIRFDSEIPAYSLMLGDGRIVPLGTIECLTSQTKFRNQVAAAVGILPKKIKPEAWENRVRALLATIQHDTAGFETTTTGMVMEWLQAYLQNVVIHETRENGLTDGQPWREEGRVHIVAAPFRAWLAIHLQEKVPVRTLGLALRQIRAEPVTLSTGTTTRSAWKLPKTF